jgi:bifunctional DNA-binding transcriptional regulator/antitoxin component of YhaV-PrlF toxin-antitoxin module
MSLQSTVGIARTGAKSLRATVPEGIVAFLELNEGDRLEWRMDVQDNERRAIVRKAKPTNEETAKTTFGRRKPRGNKK